MKLLLAGAAAAALLLTGAQASAATIVVTSATLDSFSVQVAVPGHGNEFASFININNGQFGVFCDDLFHSFSPGAQNPPIIYKTGLVTTDSNGNLLTMSQSNRMGQLAEKGRFIHLTEFGQDRFDDEAAIQGAIWAIEYGINVTSSDPTIQAEITQFLTVADNGKGFAQGLISQDRHQSFVIGGVPEPTTWAMMILGLGAVGVAMRNRRKLALAA